MKNEPIRDEFLEKRKARQRRARKKRMITGFIVFVIIALITLVILSLTVFFPIERITASGSKIYTSEEIIATSGIKKGDNIFTFDKKTAESLLKAKLPYIENVEFIRDFPSGLSIKVNDAKPYYCILVNGEYYSISKAEWVLEKSIEKPENIFEMKIKDVKSTVGSKLVFNNEKTKNIFEKTLKLLEDNEIKIDYIDVTNPIIIKAGVEGRFDVNFGTENSLESKIKHLRKTMDAIPKNESGSINLSMWNDQKPEGTFVKNNTK